MMACSSSALPQWPATAHRKINVEHMIIIIKESLLFYRFDGEPMYKGLAQLGGLFLVISIVAHRIKLSTCPDPLSDLTRNSFKLRDEDNPTL